MISQCAECSKFIKGDVSDPVITAKSLGWKNYHDACAKAVWKRLGRSGELTQRKSKESTMADKKIQFYVQCTLWTNGKEENQWHNIVDTLAEAEGYADKQMSPSDFAKDWAAMGYDDEVYPTRGGVECNMSPKKYVNCTIYMMLKTGKRTVVDERVNRVAPKPVSADEQMSEQV